MRVDIWVPRRRGTQFLERALGQRQGRGREEEHAQCAHTDLSVFGGKCSLRVGGERIAIYASRGAPLRRVSNARSGFGERLHAGVHATQNSALQKCSARALASNEKDKILKIV